MKFSTRAIHIGQGADPVTGATILPIYQTSTYTQQEIGKHRGYEYSRTGNPTRAVLEECLASLEEAQYGAAFASGVAATTAVLSLLRPGDHVVAAEDLYGGTYRLFEKVYTPFGITFTYIDGRQPEEFAKAARRETKLVWVETPTNPLLRLTDIEAVSRVCRDRKISLAVDNTFATPYLQKPLLLGADLVVHSTTKYIGGHSDLVGGAVLTNNAALIRDVKFYQNAARSGAGSLRLLARAARDQNSFRQNAPARGKRAENRGIPLRAFQGRGGVLPGAAGPPPARPRIEADERFRRHAFFQDQRRQGSRQFVREIPEDFRLCRKPGRR